MNTLKAGQELQVKLGEAVVTTAPTYTTAANQFEEGVYLFSRGVGKDGTLSTSWQTVISPYPDGTQETAEIRITNLDTVQHTVLFRKSNAGVLEIGLTITLLAGYSAICNKGDWYQLDNLGNRVFGSTAAIAEQTYTPTGTTATINLAFRFSTLALTSATGDVTATLTVPTTPSNGRIISKNHASASKKITWAVSAGTLYYMDGTAPDTSLDAVSTRRVWTWTFDGVDTYLSATGVGA